MTGARNRDPDVTPDTEVSAVRGELTRTEWTFRDRRHRGFLLGAGRGRLVTPEGEIPFVSPCLLWLPAGPDRRLLFDAGTRGHSLAVTEVGLAGALPVGPVSRQIRGALSRPVVQARLDLHHARRLAETLAALAEEAAEDAPGAPDSVRHLLALFLIGCWRLSGPVHGEAKPLPRTIVQRFLHAVDLNLRAHWTIARYAAEIGVTPDRLNSAVRRATGRPPLALIHARLVHEADALLETSSLQVAEIADELGFSDPAYFSRFYKRLTGRPPNSQRHELRGGARRGSYAAWP